MASMRFRSPPRMQTSRLWLSRAARTGGFDADPLAFACECGRPGRRHEWATSAETGADPADAPVAAIAAVTAGRIPDNVSTLAADLRVVVPVQVVDDPEPLNSSTGTAAPQL